MTQTSTLAAALFASSLFFLLFTTGDAVQCYICSWSPRNQANRTDFCTHANFNPEKNFAHECPQGCEFFSQNDLNGDFEHVRRNCAPSNPPHRGCLTETSRAWTTVRCICDSDYCNAAPQQHRTTAALLLLPLLLAAASRMPT
uniref:Uncharacterized protein n=1 Tax=Rhipicephalus appendiculatus TaxID=34631 RepID=A0A131YMA8_RHIAP